MIKYLVASIIFVVLDGLYINLIKTAFGKQIAAIQGSVMKPNFIAVAITYVFLLFGLNYFILRKYMNPKDAFLFGLVIYAVYDSTNYATLKKWSPSLAIMDTLWGGVLMASSGLLGGGVSALANASAVAEGAAGASGTWENNGATGIAAAHSVTHAISLRECNIEITSFQG